MKDELFFKVNRAVNSVLAKHGLNANEAVLYATVYSISDQKPSITDITYDKNLKKFLSIKSLAGFRSVIESLVKKGFLTLRRDPKNECRKIIEVSKNGIILIAELNAAIARELEAGQ